MTKLERLEGERERMKERLSEYQTKLRALDAQVTAQENVEIVVCVRALDLTRAELRDFKKAAGSQRGERAQKQLLRNGMQSQSQRHGLKKQTRTKRTPLRPVCHQR